MPNFSAKWGLMEQLQAVAAGTWTGLPLYSLYAWGYNTQGQLGLNDTVRRSSPVQVGALVNWAQVSAGFYVSSAIKTDGTLWAWGNNSNGSVGDGTTINRSNPVQVGALTNWYQVSSGGIFTAAVKTDGSLWAWGFNTQGQLGQNNVIPRSSPVQVGALTNWAQVSSGRSTLSVKTDGTLWGWGLNDIGTVGDGTVINRSSPVQVGALTNWARVSSGTLHTAAVKTDGTIWAWGDNRIGQLGDGTANNRRSSPVQVGALTNWSRVSAGRESTFSIKTDGTLWSWGVNNRGQLGQNNVIDRSSPVQIGALTNWSTISAGAYGSSTSVKTDGTLWVWGSNAYGQLGDGTIANRSSPVQIGALTKWTMAVTNYATLAIFQGSSN
jgi:alpha-tubulin suppressor-like RCC1 family protein